MIHRVNDDLEFTAFFGTGTPVTGKTGLTAGELPTVDAYRAGSPGSPLVTGASSTEVGGGLYTYTLPKANVTTADRYLAVFKTTNGTVVQQHVPVLVSVVDWTEQLTNLFKLGWNRLATAGNKLVLYDDDGTTVLKEWDLKDAAGLPTTTNPMERTPA